MIERTTPQSETPEAFFDDLHPKPAPPAVAQQLQAMGIVEWFRPGEYEHAEESLLELAALGVKRLRTGISWADWMCPGTAEWYDWLLPRLASQVELLPCLLYTPPSMGIQPRTSSPPRNPGAYADFMDVVLTRYGRWFEYVELWNEPNNVSEWDWTLDPQWQRFCEMVGAAAYWARHRGYRTVLGGMSPIDANWLEMVFGRGVMQYIDVVGIHGFPGTFDSAWRGWEANVSNIRETIRRNGSAAEVWITETGCSTWRHDVRRQVVDFLHAAASGAERVYWYALKDLDPQLPTVDGFHSDEKEYHFGLRTADGQAKLLRRLWEGGAETFNRCHYITRPPRRRSQHVLITGGAGFIGANLADRLACDGCDILLLDNLSRPGVERNLHWLREKHPGRVEIEVADIRDRHALARCVRHAGQVFHLAAQVAVTTSLTDPMDDFQTNALGTVSLLEAIRACPDPPPLLFTSTNKVYGSLGDLALRQRDRRYEPVHPDLRRSGVDESRPLDFHSPYGCSKGAADQYVLDYCRTFELPVVVFRMSCIHGPHQFGTEDQGWVAHFLIRALKHQELSIYGDGMQVRDILYVEDLVQAMLLAQRRMPAIAGRAFNIGGGPENVISLLDLIDLIGVIHGQRPGVQFHGWRPGDQRYYVSDTSAFQQATGWRSSVPAREGVERLYHWLRQTQGVGADLAATGGP